MDKLKKQILQLTLAAAVGLRDFVSLDTLKSSCQNPRTKLFVISGKNENVEKYQFVQKTLEREEFRLKTNEIMNFFRLSR